MTKTRTITIDSNMDLCYSPDEKIWYFYKYGRCNSGVDDLTSDEFKTRAVAMKAYKNKILKWETLI